MFFIDEAALITFLAGFISYMVLFIYQLRKKEPAKYNVFQLIYKNWVKNITEEAEPIVGIQALRNFIRGTATLVSGLLILIGVFVGFFSDIAQNCHPMFGISSLTLGLMQFSLTMCMLIFCIFNFILCLRYATRLSILIVGMPKKYAIGDVEGFELTKKTLTKAITHWMLGIRCLFFFATSFFWYLNSFLFIVISIAVSIFLGVTHEVI